MKKRGLPVILASIMIFTFCDKGLQPPGEEAGNPVFTIEPLGGNPTGSWVPADTLALEVLILDETAIPSLVDSQALNPGLEGFFYFDLTGVCSLSVVVSIAPQVWVSSLPEPISFLFTDTLKAAGPFEMIDDKIMILPMENQVFRFDTVGVSSYPPGIDLISVDNTFSYEGILTLPVTFIFHLQPDLSLSRVRKWAPQD